MTNATPNDNRSELERRTDLFHLYNEFLKDESHDWQCDFCQGAVHNTKADYVEIKWDETWKLWGAVVIDDHPVISGPLHDKMETPYFTKRDEALKSIDREMVNFKVRRSGLTGVLNATIRVYVYNKNGTIAKKYLFTAYENSTKSYDVLMDGKAGVGGGVHKRFLQYESKVDESTRVVGYLGGVLHNS